MLESVNKPLVDEDTGVRIHLAGVCTYAPDQQYGLEQLFESVSPTHIAVEQPPDPQPVLPHPRWLQTTWDTLGDDASSSTFPGPTLQKLHASLRALSFPKAQVGRDIMDPFELLGFFPGLDLMRSPQHVATALQDFGFIPGLEFLKAAQLAAEHGLEFAHLDAPIKLQEVWVQRLREEFQTREQDYAYNPGRHLQTVQAALPPDIGAWDEALARATAEQAISLQSNSSSSRGAEEAMEELALVRYKVSRAVAAAALGPAAVALVLQPMQRLQPLKFRHMAEREEFMARRLREVSSKAAADAGLLPAAMVPAASMGSGTRGGPQGKAADTVAKVAPANSSSGKPPVVVAVIGRQHVAGIRKAWGDKGSGLWKDVVPRSFSSSMEVVAGDIDSNQLCTGL